MVTGIGTSKAVEVMLYAFFSLGKKIDKIEESHVAAVGNSKESQR